VKLVVRPGFGSDQDQRQKSQCELESAGALFAGAHFATAPLSCWAVAKVRGPQQDTQFCDRADGGNDQHRNSDCVLMKPANGTYHATGQNNRSQPYSESYSIEGEEKRTYALEDCDEQASALHDLQTIGVIHSTSES